MQNNLFKTYFVCQILINLNCRTDLSGGCLVGEGRKEEDYQVWGKFEKMKNNIKHFV